MHGALKQVKRNSHIEETLLCSTFKTAIENSDGLSTLIQVD